MRLLICEDEEDILNGLAKGLRKLNYYVDTATDGEEALSLYFESEYDLIVLDLNMPKLDGLEVLKAIREDNPDCKIIILSARDTLNDKVLGLDLGANDYMVKPFDSKELVARAKAVMRRYQKSKQQPDEKGQNIVEYPDLSINLSNYSVVYKGNTVDMPPKELELLYFLASSPNQVFTREQLLDHIWGYEYIGDTRTVDVHIKRLREKIKDHNSWAISTVWGIGYKFELRKSGQL